MIKPEDRVTPLEVRAPRGGRVLEIDFADGHHGVYPHAILRGYCPCAVCQGHQGPIRFIPGGNEELSDLAEVGDYALRMTWGDGHATGIYTFDFLRDLCSCAECNPPGADDAQAGTASAGLGGPDAAKTYSRGGSSR